mmetsp:Transcript_8922/g.9271  ORF Transcript_8922/g.9271 Transcript_8922/m.9271 type:complete len:86 (+) Transcript_8922:7-264(+)
MNLKQELEKQKLPRNFGLLGKTSDNNLLIRLTETCISKCEVNFIQENSSKINILNNCLLKGNSMLQYIDGEYKNIKNEKDSFYIY